MNYQELIEKIGNLDKLYGEKFYVALDDVLNLVKQLDEPQKVTIPQFVADWIEEARETTYNIRGAIEMAPNGRVKDWLELKNVNSYEVEKEKRYKISVKSNKQILIKFQKRLKKWFEFADIKIKEPYYTRKELEEVGFGWVFDCEGIEIEEVK